MGIEPIIYGLAVQKTLQYMIYTDHRNRFSH